MLCQKCKKNEATVHIQKAVGNYKTDLHLCADCAKQEGEMPSTHFGQLFDFNVGDFLSGMLGIPGSVQAAPKEKACPRCGMRLSEISKHGRLGCPACYEAFRAELRPLLKQIHGADRHTGKLPEHAAGALKLQKQKEELQEKLQQAVESERYEDAAKLRDEIRSLEQKPEGGASDEK